MGNLRRKISVGNFRRNVAIGNFPRILFDGNCLRNFRRTTKIRRLLFSTTIFLRICVRRKHPISDEFLVLLTNYCRRKNTFFCSGDNVLSWDYGSVMNYV